MSLLALDTNVVVRFLTGDDPKQSIQARQLLAEHDVVVAATVLLETEWVLRKVFGFGDDAILSALRGFIGLPRVRLAEADQVLRALAWAEKGMTFADALHLAFADGCDAFVTFDRAIPRRMANPASVPVRAP